jgi:archaetidylinositol phosphate synthase
MSTGSAFKGDQKKPINSITGGAEQRLIRATIGMIPPWIEGYHLTLTTLLWSAGLILFGYLAQYNIHWLWASSGMVFLQWFSDSYDGALGRLRDTGIPKWGYYMDHLLDYVFLASVFIGYSFLVGEGQMRALFVMLILFTAFMMNSYLSFAATSEFKISFLGFGPTEGRILFILFNAYLILFGLGAVEKVLVFVIPAVLLGLSVVIFRTQRYIWHVDMAEKRERLEGGGIVAGSRLPGSDTFGSPGPARGL